MSGDLYGIDVSAPAVVLKFDPNVMHHGGLGAIRSLGRLGVPVYGVHEGRWRPRPAPVTWRAACSGRPIPLTCSRCRPGC